MSRIPRAALGPLLGAALFAGGCSLLTGASDLTTEPALSSTPPKDGSSGDSPFDPKVDGGGGPTEEGGSTGEDGGVDATSATSLRAVTFESGSLTGTNGGDTVTGSPVVTTQYALRGKYSMTVAGPSMFVEAAIPNVAQSYTSFAFTVATFPDGGASATIARFTFGSSATTLDVSVSEGAGAKVIIGGASIGLGGVLQVGVSYRVGIHITLTGTNMKVEAQIVEGAATPLGPKSGGVGMGSLGPLTRISLGSLGPESITALLDQLLVDSAAMPAP